MTTVDLGPGYDLDEIWAAYEAAAIGELDRTPATIAGYGVYWRQFQAWLGPGTSPEAILGATVKYREDLRRQRLATNTIYARISGLKAIWRWTFDAGLIDADPLARFRLPRKIENPRPAIDQEAYEELLGRLGQLDPVPRVIIALAAYAGLRAGEIRNLNAEDIDLEARSVTVRQGKGRKDRVVRIHPDLAAVLQVTRYGPPTSIADRIRTLCARDGVSLTAAAVHVGLNPKRLRIIVAGGGMQIATARLLARWDREWPIEWWVSQAGSRRFGRSGRPLIVGRYGGRIAKNAVYKTVTSCIDACPHRFRTTWITVLLEHRVPIQVVADEAGHVALDTTRAYIGRRDRAAREQMDQVRFGPPQVAPAALAEPPRSPVLTLAAGEQAGDDEVSEEEGAAWEADMARKWAGVLERNPWFPLFLASGHKANGNWFSQATSEATGLRYAGHLPGETRVWGGHRATIADIEALGEFVYVQECTQPPLCLDGPNVLQRPA